MDYIEQNRIKQDILVAVDRARFALELSASAERPTTVTLRYEHGEIAFSVEPDKR